jgi:hypothetical protein
MQLVTSKKKKWYLRGLYLDSCNCDWGCPCQFNAKPTHGNCEGLSAIHINEGKYGNIIRLDRLNFVFVGSWPGALHEGHGKAAVYIDDRATNDQFEALSKIVTGKAKGSAFDVYSKTLDYFQESRRAKITFQANGIKSMVKAEGVGEAQLEPIRNPVTGKVHQVAILQPKGFEAPRLDMASSKLLIADDGLLHFKYEGTYGGVQKISWKGTGP